MGRSLFKVYLRAGVSFKQIKSIKRA